MKLIYKDAVGFSCLILIAILGGLFLFENQSSIVSISDHRNEHDDEEITKQIQRYVVDSTFVVIGMIIFMICIIVMIMTFSRNPMLSNIRNIKEATSKISKGDFNSRIPISGNPDEITELCQDINEMARKLNQQQQKSIKDEKLIAIGNFSSRLAHDMRNPLSIIQITLDNLRLLYGENKVQQNYFKKIERSIARMTHQIDNVLDFVKEKPMELKTTKTSKIIFESLDSVITPELIDVIIPQNDVEITCDEKQLVIMFNNLILNSIQAIGDSSGSIKIRIEDGIDEIAIEVEDSGIGITDKLLYKIFDPLFTTKQQGTGLGLASVKSIVDSHGGIVSVTSPPTIFTIILPKIKN